MARRSIRKMRRLARESQGGETYIDMGDRARMREAVNQIASHLDHCEFGDAYGNYMRRVFRPAGKP